LKSKTSQHKIDLTILTRICGESIYNNQLFIIIIIIIIYKVIKVSFKISNLNLMMLNIFYKYETKKEAKFLEDGITTTTTTNIKINK
jgi:hypothetical protein